MAVEMLEAAELEKIGETERKALDEAKTKHGEAYLLEAKDAGVRVVCRKPTRAIYNKFRAERQDPARKPAAFENLFLACLVFPPPIAFQAVLDDKPAIGDTFGVALWDKISGAEDASVKRG